MTPWASLLLAALGCSKPQAPELRVDVGPNDKKSFAPVSAFAEYVELPGIRNELRITLASYAASCDKFVSPGPSDVLLTATVITPPKEPPRPGRYVSGGASGRAHAELSVRMGQRAMPMPAGGALSLSQVELEAQGSVEGELGFDSPGDAEHGAKSVRGRFSARVCRSNSAGRP